MQVQTPSLPTSLEVVETGTVPLHNPRTNLLIEGITPLGVSVFFFKVLRQSVSGRAPPQADMSEVVQRVIEGFRREAILIARHIGLDRLCQPDGLEYLLERIKQHVFPLQSQEASKLFRVGQLRTGPLSRQQGESMLSYVSRRKRWRVTLQELDGEIKLSEAMHANLLVELSGLQGASS